jgi:hypothetical protein
MGERLGRIPPSTPTEPPIAPEAAARPAEGKQAARGKK